MSDAMAEVEALLTEEPDSNQDALEQVTELLQPEGVAATEPVGDDDTDEETLEAEPEAEVPDGVDYSAEIPMSDGSRVKLGELKDHYQAHQKHTLELQERENALMNQMNELSAVSQHVQLPPEQLAVIKGRQEEHLKREHQRMLDVIPEFRDQTAFTEAKKGIESLAAEYGIQDAVAQIADHRIVKLLNDFARLRSGIKAAKDNVKPLRSKDPKAQNRAAGKIDPAQQAAQRAAQTGRRADQISAVSALLK